MNPSTPASPLLTVVIPTHNRARYATHSIRSVLAIEADDLEVIVHDTSEDDALERFADGMVDRRLRYVRCHEALSMTENHNRAMALAQGEYVCLIGDDDSILPAAIEATRWASRHRVLAIAPEVVANYAWPDFRSRAFGAGHAGRLYMKRRFGSAGMRDARASMDASLARAALGTDGLPKVYHGIVARSVMEQVRERGGAYFYGTSPDVSGAIAIASLVGEYLWIDFPLTLPGASAGSNTGRSATKTHTGTIESDPHTRRFRDLQWPQVLPRFVSVETVWAHAVHATLAAVAPEAMAAYNMPRLYAECLLRSYRYRNAIGDAMQAWQRASGVGKAESWRLVAAEYAGALFRSTTTLALRASRPTAAGGRLHAGGIPDIAACVGTYPTLLRQARVDAPLDQLLAAGVTAMHAAA